MVDAYLELQKHLSSDNLEAAKKSAATLAQKTETFKPRAPEKGRQVWQTLQQPIVLHATQAATADSLERARQVFEPLSDRMIQLLGRFGSPLEAPVKLAFCPMAGSGGKGAHWLQRADKVENPFYGAKMYTCGEVKQDIATGQRPSMAETMPPPQAAPAGGHQH